MNPVVDTEFDGFRNFTFQPEMRVAYNFSAKVALAAEYYADFGRVPRFLAPPEQSQTLFAVVDLGNSAHGIEFGRGRAEPSIATHSSIERLRRLGARELLFRVSVGFKGLDGLLELIGGATLLTVSPAFILRTVRLLTQDEIAEDPRDLVANALRRIAAHLSFASEHFIALYLLIHGMVKMGLVWALLARVLIAYPLSIAIFAGFIAYQIYRYTFTHSLGLLVLTALDFLVIALIYLEYRALRRGRA